MFLSKVTLKPGPKLFELLGEKSGSNGYAAHQLLWDLFPNDGEKKRDFLFHKDEPQELPSFIVVSKDAPVETEALRVQSKPYAPQLSVGQKLTFSLTANPVVGRKTEGKKNSIKHDVWMDAKKTAQENGLEGSALVSACETASKEWLIRQGERCGFQLTVNDVLVDGYLQNRFFKGKGKDAIRYSTIHFEGVLTVTDPALFTKMLGEGLGKSKAFGCGMMLVRRA